MIVGGFCKRRWNYDSSSVNCLPNIAEINSSSYFLYQDWSQSFGPKRLVDAEEVDFSHYFLDTINRYMHRDA